MVKNRLDKKNSIRSGVPNARSNGLRLIQLTIPGHPQGHHIGRRKNREPEA